MGRYFLLFLLLSFNSHTFNEEKRDRQFLDRFSANVEKSEETKELVSIAIESNQFADIDVSYLAKWKGLKHVGLKGTKITDEGIRFLADLRKLQFLVMRDNLEVTGVGFASLKGLSDLESLVLIGCPITDDGLTKISELDSLINLNLAKTRITDRGLSAINKLKKLESLSLSRTKITNEGILQLKSAKNIRALILAGTSIDDKAVQIIASLQSLTWLNISDTDISDRSIEKIATIAKLQVLDIRRTKITVDGFYALKKRFPKAAIEFDPTAIR